MAAASTLLTVAASCLLIVAVAGGAAQGQNAMASSTLSSRDRETQKLFQIVLSGEKPPGQCRYDKKWSYNELPDYLAIAEFGISVEAGLVPPSEVGEFRSLIDPGRRIAASAFCSDDELKSYTARRIGEFEKNSESDMQIDRTEVTYPIFNKFRTKAVVIVTHLALEGRLRFREGQIGRHPVGIWVGAKVYRKFLGRWLFVWSTTIGIS